MGQAFRYGGVAGLAALVYLGIYGGLLALGLHYLLAIVVAQLITIALAFPAYRSIVFRSTGPLWPDFLRFISVWMTGALAGAVITPVLVELLHVHPFPAQVVAVVVVAVGSFLGHKLFTFRKAAVPGVVDEEKKP